MQLRDIRQRRGFTQEDVARLADITVRNYILIEKGEIEPRILTALSICRALSVDPRDIEWAIKKRAYVRKM